MQQHDVCWTVLLVLLLLLLLLIRDWWWVVAAVAVVVAAAAATTPSESPTLLPLHPSSIIETGGQETANARCIDPLFTTTPAHSLPNPPTPLPHTLRVGNLHIGGVYCSFLVACSHYRGHSM